MMQDETASGSKRQKLVLAAIGAVLGGLLLGLVIGYGVRQPGVSSLQDEVTSLQGLIQEQDVQAQEEVARLEQRIEGRVEELGQVKAVGDRLQQDLAATQQENQQLQGQVQEQQRLAELAQVEQDLTAQTGQVASLGELVDLLNVDRLILVELRKDLPLEERQEALDYWTNVKGLAARSQSALGTKADQVVKAVPSYFDWLETPFETTEERSAMHFLLGANRYEDLTNEFLEDALLVVINRLDQVAELTEVPTG